ncbi:hypothetical protein RB195_022088 [Necator americanus]|uniref:Carbohydrate kinase PfkB domain-containing protein n=1 Tax=Necator americanus TaxID=51031 RepID=A0ABR1EE75_NECAM
METSKELGLCGGTILACPIPKEFQLDGNKIEDVVQMALKESKEKGILSKDVTPFVLGRVNEMTSGVSMRTNIALLKNNARIGGQLASSLAKQKQSRIVLAIPSEEQNAKPSKRPKIVIIGATIVDFESLTEEEVKNDGASYAGRVTKRCGGVGRNHADALTSLGCDVSFVSVVGNDDNGKYFLDQCSHMDCSRVEMVEDLPTAVYTSVNVRGEVQFGISSIGEIVSRISPEMILRNEDVISTAEYVLFDGNVPTETITKIVDLTRFYKGNGA